MIEILVVEDDLDVRLSLINILKSDPEIRVVGESGDGNEAVKMAKALLPDLVLMDIKLHGLNGLEAAKQIKDYYQSIAVDIKIIILSTFYDNEFVAKSREYEVDGYLLKEQAYKKLTAAIKSICEGFVTFDRAVYKKQNELPINDVNKKAELCNLTRAELKVLKLIVSGNKNADIAGQLYLSEGTVRNYVSSMMSKLGCKNGRELAVFGIKAGL